MHAQTSLHAIRSLTIDDSNYNLLPDNTQPLGFQETNEELIMPETTNNEFIKCNTTSTEMLVSLYKSSPIICISSIIPPAQVKNPAFYMFIPCKIPKEN